MKRYVFFCTLSYSFTILRPLQTTIQNRGDEVRWFLEKTCPDRLTADEKRLYSIREVIEYNPYAIFSAGDYIYDFFPGVKVAVFHGYPINKRKDAVDVHFKIRGWYDIYCTQGPSSTKPFMQLEKQKGYFKVYETGWPKADAYFHAKMKTNEQTRQSVRILYASTFTKGISSAPELLLMINRLAQEKPWQWLLTLHPKIDPLVRMQYKALANRFPNVKYKDNVTPEDMMQTDVLLCDSSSIIVEYMLLNKPVVTYRNTQPGPYLLDVKNAENIPAAIDKALTLPEELMRAQKDFVSKLEAHQDGRNCERVLQAVDDFVLHWQGHLAPKPRNIFRKIKLRLSLRYFHQ